MRITLNRKNDIYIYRLYVSKNELGSQLDNIKKYSEKVSIQGFGEYIVRAKKNILACTSYENRNNLRTNIKKNIRG